MQIWSRILFHLFLHLYYSHNHHKLANFQWHYESKHFWNTPTQCCFLHQLRNILSNVSSSISNEVIRFLLICFHAYLPTTREFSLLLEKRWRFRLVFCSTPGSYDDSAVLRLLDKQITEAPHPSRVISWICMLFKRTSETCRTYSVEGKISQFSRAVCTKRYVFCSLK